MSADQTILLVEDNLKDVFLIQRAFRKAEISTPIQVVNDGDAAVLYLSGQPPYHDRQVYPFPALVLLDLKLPRRSGAEVLRWLRRFCRKNSLKGKNFYQGHRFKQQFQRGLR